jgi:hypothetical protein
VRTAVFPLAMGIVCSAGLLPPFRLKCSGWKKTLDGRCIYACIAAACALVSMRNGAALLHPKLVALTAVGTFLAAAQAFVSRSRASYAMLPVAFLMLSGPILNVPSPTFNARATAPEHLFPGQELHFAGMLARYEGSRMLFRYVITCCRADAAPIALRLDRHVGERDGTWIDVVGIIFHDGGSGLALRVERYRRINPPADPFLYK